MPPPPSVDPRSGFCFETKTFHSLRPALDLPPASHHLSFTSFAFSLLPSPLPTHPAFVDATTGDAISFPHLVSTVHSIAAALHSHFSITKGSVAFVLSPARLDVPLLYFALLSLGAVVSPANPALSAAEISKLVDLSKPSVAFTVSTVAHKLPPNLPAILMDSTQFHSFCQLKPLRSPVVSIRQSDRAAILYSSGTTGRVKAAVLMHRNLIAVAAAQLNSNVPTERVVMMLTVPLFHVYGFTFCTKGVLGGETVVIQTARFNARAVMKAVERFRVTRLALAPPALLAIVRLVEEEEGMVGDLRSLRAVSCGGAPVGIELIQRFLKWFPGVYVAQVCDL